MNEYVQLDALKDTLELSGTTFVEADATAALTAASRAIDNYCGRRFYLDESDQSRYYSPWSGDQLWIDDLSTLTSLASDPGGDNTFEDTWTVNVDFVLEPRSAAADGFPYTSVRRLRGAANFRGFTTWTADTVKITGKFGWSEPPAPVIEATTILATRFLRRAREAPFGIITVGLDAGAARISRLDPDVRMLLDPYTRWRPLV